MIYTLFFSHGDRWHTHTLSKPTLVEAFQHFMFMGKLHNTISVPLLQHIENNSMLIVL